MRLALAALLLATAARAEAPPRVTSQGAKEAWRGEVTIVIDRSIEDIGATDATRVGFGAWMAAAKLPMKVTFVLANERAAAERDGVSRVLATRDVLAGHERDVAYTVTWADAATGTIEEADVVFNTRYAFADVPIKNCEDTWDAASVATHEAGHFFGLAEDLSDRDATMWILTTPCDAHKRALTDADLRSIARVYEPVRTTDATVTAPSAHSCAAAGTASGGALPIALAMIVLRLRRRHRR